MRQPSLISLKVCMFDFVYTLAANIAVTSKQKLIDLKNVFLRLQQPLALSAIWRDWKNEFDNAWKAYLHPRKKYNTINKRYRDQHR